MNTLPWSRVEQRLWSLRINLAELGRRMGESPQVITNWKSRGVPEAKREKLARVLECSLHWLLTGEEEVMIPLETGEVSSTGLDPIRAWESPDELPPERYVLVPRLNIRLSAGPGSLVYEVNREQSLAFLTDWIRGQRLNPRRLVAMQVAGESMEPRLTDGDTLLVDLSQTMVYDGRIYAIRYGDELRVKRLFKRYDGGLLLRSDNLAIYPEEFIPPEGLEFVQVIGRVVWVGGVV